MLPKISKLLLNWRNFAKSGHTGADPVVHLPLLKSSFTEVLVATPIEIIWYIPNLFVPYNILCHPSYTDKILSLPTVWVLNGC